MIWLSMMTLIAIGLLGWSGAMFFYAPDLGVRVRAGYLLALTALLFLVRFSLGYWLQ